ncbi:MAG: hypothetical protein RLW62_07310, partial [Gammaproteobacteria bacterium]
LLCALVLDLAWHLATALVRRPLLAAGVGALAFALKPLALVALAALFAVEAGALRHGIVFPLLTHAAFGACGAAIGALLWEGTRPR